MRKRLVSIGNSYGLVIEKPILELLKIRPDTELELSTDGRSLVVTPRTGDAQHSVIEGGHDGGVVEDSRTSERPQGPYDWTNVGKDEALVRLTELGRTVGADAKKPGTKTRARWERFLAALDAAGGEMSVAAAREILGAHCGPDLAWEQARRRIQVAVGEVS